MIYAFLPSILLEKFSNLQNNEEKKKCKYTFTDIHTFFFLSLFLSCFSGSFETTWKTS